jgi:hypothetical protein
MRGSALGERADDEASALKSVRRASARDSRVASDDHQIVTDHYPLTT